MSLSPLITALAALAIAPPVLADNNQAKLLMETVDTSADHLLSFEARDIQGQLFDLAEASEQGPVLVVVWYAACPTCPQELARLQEWASKHYEEPVRIVGISGDVAERRAWLRPFLNSLAVFTGASLARSISNSIDRARGARQAGHDPRTDLIGG